MEMTDFEMYQMTAERIKDDVMQQNRKLERKLSEKDQSFELVKMVHFDKSIDLQTLNDIIIGCTGCMHSLMFYHHQVITNLDKSTPLYELVIAHKDQLTASDDMLVTDNLIPDYTAVMYPVSTSEMLSESKRFVKHIVMLYPTHRMTSEVLEFAKSFMIVNEVLINIVLTRAKMMELIETDPMTKVLNRSSWTDNLTELVESKSPFFVLFFDLDNFKNLNDVYGHQKGDDILKFVSEWLKNAFRGDDRIFRLGGDEFAVTGHINSDHIDGLKEKFAGLNAYYKQSVKAHLNLESTISIGAFIAQRKYTEQEVYALVDNLLYESKQKGRDTITLVTEI
jgi:diguanylate cyclase (GGDEF)-like protein